MIAARLTIGLACCLAASAVLADSYSLTIVTDARVAVTAPQEWSRRLAAAGVQNFRIRSGRAGDKTGIEEVDLGTGKRYQITGLLTSADTLELPGARFTRRDLAKLQDYLDGVVADGAESVTESRGQFGLTKSQFEAAFGQLGKPINRSTEGQPLQGLIDEFARESGWRVEVAPLVRPTLARLACQDELQPLSYGCGLAIALKAEGLAMAPAKPRGKPLQLRVGLATETDEPWPIGWPTKARGTELAPQMFQKINVEIEGFSLQEAIDAIGPRIDMPVLWDHAMLASKRIDPAGVQVKLPPANMAYHRILSRLLFQARLRGEVRVDEAGGKFYWISR